jgi:hypothetical protein
MACSTTGMAVVPESLQLTAAMKAQNWAEPSMVPLKFTIGVEELDSVPAQDVISKHMGSAGSIAFVVRRPG